ncbi:MAG: mechanosensitive ion channel [Bacteriovoracaceae bacterium]|nr:mechanosensitive ion channel [Bacteriovoracaceae bacterium]
MLNYQTLTLPAWLTHKFWLLSNWQWFGILVIIFVAFAIERLAQNFASKITVKIMSRYDIDIPDKYKKRALSPIGIMVFAGVFVCAVQFLNLPGEFLAIISRGGKIILTVTIILTAHHAVNIISLYFEKLARESQNKFDDILVPLIRKTLKFFVVIIGIVFIGNSLTLDMKSIIAGMGIGGIAFALAAKDTISNLFGSLTVLLDRPFRIGDWVNIGGEVDGMVEEVGLRSTRIRTFYNSLVTLPNGKLTNVHIDNFGQRRFRRFKTKISVQYDTSPKKIEAFCEGIRQIILKHRFTRKDYFHVYLNDLGSSSLDILLYVFWEVPDWSTELAEKHRLLIDVLRLGNEMGVEFAFPTQTLHLHNNEATQETDTMNSDLDFHEQGKKFADEIINSPITMKKPRSVASNGTFPKDEIGI